MLFGFLKYLFYQRLEKRERMTPEQWKELIGQIIGLVAAVIISLSYQANTKKSLLMVQSIGIVFLCANYLLLDAWTGFALNLVCLTRNLSFYFAKEGTKFYYALTAVLMLVMGCMGILSWQGPISLLMIVALVANTFFHSLGKPQILRYSIVVTSTLVLLYNIAVFSIGGILTEAISIISAIVGIALFLFGKTKPKDVKID